MSEKQLNFLHIFDDANKRDELKAEIQSDDYPENEEETSSDPLEENFQEEQDRLKADKITFAGIKAAEQAARQERYNRLLRLPPAKLSLFNEFITEIENYSQRIRQFRQELEQVDPGEEKEKIYKKIVNPNLYDEEEYREIAAIYLNYLEALKNEKDDNNQVSLNYLKNEQNEKTIKKLNRQEMTSSEGNDSNDIDEEADEPDPYGEIYPMSRQWKKNKE